MGQRDVIIDVPSAEEMDRITKMFKASIQAETDQMFENMQYMAMGIVNLGPDEYKVKEDDNG